VVSLWFPTAAARVRSRVWSSGICGGQSGAGQVFSEYFSFLCQSSFHQLLQNHPHLSSGAGTIGQKWLQYKGLSPIPLAIKKRKYLCYDNISYCCTNLLGMLIKWEEGERNDRENNENLFLFCLATISCAFTNQVLNTHLLHGRRSHKMNITISDFLSQAQIFQLLI
jgi:hypothetical protein